MTPLHPATTVARPSLLLLHCKLLPLFARRHRFHTDLPCNAFASRVRQDCFPPSHLHIPLCFCSSPSHLHLPLCCCSSFSTAPATMLLIKLTTSRPFLLIIVTCSELLVDISHTQ